MRAFSRKLMIGGAAVCGACAAALAVAPAARAADDLPYVDIPPIDIDVDVDLGIHGPRYDDPRYVYAGIPPGHYGREIERPLVAPDQVAAMLRSTGFSLLGPVHRRGWVYTVAVLDPRGDDGRVIVDARTGAIIRFLPAFTINGRTERDLAVLYGPPGPPLISRDMLRPPRPPINPPKVASRPPSPLPRPQPRAKPGASATGQALVKPASPPAQRSASTQPKPGEAASPEAAKPMEAKPVVTRPAEVELKPTQAMPPMQTLE